MTLFSIIVLDTWFFKLELGLLKNIENQPNTFYFGPFCYSRSRSLALAFSRILCSAGMAKDRVLAQHATRPSRHAVGVQPPATVVFHIEVRAGKGTHAVYPP
jgi:hypothetical protein